jgi:SAM-dependent methyltransferase
MEPLRTGDASRHPAYHPSLPRSIEWLRCKRCSHVFTSGYFGPDALALMLSRPVEGQIVGANLQNTRLVWAEVVGRVTQLCGGPPQGFARWLDVGFGDGACMFTASEWGCEVEGLDLRTPNVDKMQSLGYRAHAKTLEDFHPDRPFSVVSLADVLEHTPFPAKTLREVRRVLRPHGYLFLSLPNMDTVLWRGLDNLKQNPYWDEIEHYHNFTRKRLVDLCVEEGFEPVNYAVSKRYLSGMEIICRSKP